MTLRTSSLLSHLLLGCSLALAAVAASAQPLYHGSTPVLVPVQARPAPPPPRHESRPKARHGMVWVEGHWSWKGPRTGYVWQPGHWVHAPRH